MTVALTMTEEELKELDDKMEAAGMTPLSKMLEGSPMGRFLAHAGVHSLDAFERWLKMKNEEFLRGRARLELDGNPEDDELFEWYLAYCSAFSQVLANFKQAREGEQSVICEKRIGRVNE
jgi:hypothetical protein